MPLVTKPDDAAYLLMPAGGEYASTTYLARITPALAAEYAAHCRRVAADPGLWSEFRRSGPFEGYSEESPTYDLSDEVDDWLVALGDEHEDVNEPYVLDRGELIPDDDEARDRLDGAGVKIYDDGLYYVANFKHGSEEIESCQVPLELLERIAGGWTGDEHTPEEASCPDSTST